MNRSCCMIMGFSGGTSGKEPICQCRRQEMQVWSLGWEVPLEEGVATCTSILAWRKPMDRGAWWATVHRVPESDRTDVTEHVWSLDMCCYGGPALGEDVQQWAASAPTSWSQLSPARWLWSWHTSARLSPLHQGGDVEKNEPERRGHLVIESKASIINSEALGLGVHWFWSQLAKRWLTPSQVLQVTWILSIEFWMLFWMLFIEFAQTQRH